MLFQTLHIVFLVVCFGSLQGFKFSDILAKFTQSDSIIKLEHMDVAEFDPIYVKQLTIKTFKHNRTQAAVNVTGIFNRDFGEEVDLLIQVYKFMSNEYRHFPVRFRVNFCSVINQNVAGLKDIMFKNGNITECPSKKGVLYQILNYVPDQKKFPPNIPNGQYLSETRGIYREVEIYRIQLFGSVSRPIVLPN